MEPSAQVQAQNHNYTLEISEFISSVEMIRREVEN
jgi:hypothetical protein